MDRKLKVSVERAAGDPTQFYVEINGLTEPLRTGHMTEARAAALKKELDASLFDASHSLMVLEVINYSLAGRGIEARMPDGDTVLLSIVESHQKKFREALEKDRDNERKKTSFERVMGDDG